MPAGAWALQGCYIDAINNIAAAAGGYVQPHNTEQVLRILSKYPTAPWNWGDVVLDFEIPTAVVECGGVTALAQRWGKVYFENANFGAGLRAI